MSVLNQKTINRDITFKGVGLHSGVNVTMTVKSAKPNSGILFKRVDLKKNNIVIPVPKKILEPKRTSQNL